MKTWDLLLLLTLMHMAEITTGTIYTSLYEKVNINVDLFCGIYGATNAVVNDTGCGSICDTHLQQNECRGFVYEGPPSQNCTCIQFHCVGIVTPTLTPGAEVQVYARNQCTRLGEPGKTSYQEMIYHVVLDCPSFLKIMLLLWVDSTLVPQIPRVNWTSYPCPGLQTPWFAQLLCP